MAHLSGKDIATRIGETFDDIIPTIVDEAAIFFAIGTLFTDCPFTIKYPDRANQAIIMN